MKQNYITVASYPISKNLYGKVKLVEEKPLFILYQRSGNGNAISIVFTKQFDDLTEAVQFAKLFSQNVMKASQE